MKQEKKRTTVYLTPTSHVWVTNQALLQGISKNDVIQMLVNKAMSESKPKSSA